MIIDVHTHVFPPEVRDNREEYLQRDATFREMYANPKSPVATADELLASMEENGVDRAVACGFAWGEAELCNRHNDYLLEAAANSGGRIIPFCTVQPSDDAARDELKRCASRGARGLGELRPHHQGYGLLDSEEADLLAWAADAYDLVLLFHTTEPVGHVYPGKSGLSVEELYRFVADFPGVTVIAAHWGGGLPFYALMPKVREELSRTYFDTAATSFLYSLDIYPRVIDLVGPERILFASDFPLTSQQRALREVGELTIDDGARRMILGENARKLLRLTDG